MISCNLIEKRESLGITQYYFKHQNIRDTYAAYHVAKTALRIANGMGNENPKFGSEIELHAELDNFSSEINNSINVLCNNTNYKIRYLSSNNLIVLQVRLKTSFSINEIVLNAQAFVKEYEKLSDYVCLKEALS